MLKFKVILTAGCIGFSSLSAMNMGNKSIQSLLPKEPQMFTGKVSTSKKKQYKKEKSWPLLVLIDGKGSIPFESLKQLSFSHSETLGEQYPRAFDNCYKRDNDPISNVLKIIHASPKYGQNVFFMGLGLESASAQEKYKTLPAKYALESYAMAAKLHNGILWEYSLDHLFKNFNRDDLLLLEGLIDKLNAGESSIKVRRNVYDRIVSLPEDIRQKFHNKNEFLQIQLMPSPTDQAIRLLVGALQGLIYGAGTGTIIELGKNTAQDALASAAMPAVAEFAKGAGVSLLQQAILSVFFGQAHRSGIENAIKVVGPILKTDNGIYSQISQIGTNAPSAYVGGFVNNPVMKTALDNQLTFAKFSPALLNQLSPGSVSFSLATFNNALMSAGSLSGTGAVLGFINALSHMGSPIKTEFITKL